MRRRAGLVLLLLLLVMLIPIREYTLVPAEVISLNSEVIAAPSDGVIHQMKVPPNTPVVAGQVLAELDDTTLKKPSRHCSGGAGDRHRQYASGVSAGD